MEGRRWERGVGRDGGEEVGVGRDGGEEVGERGG